MKTFWFFPLLILPQLALAEAPWGAVDLKIAPALHQKHCVACHAKLYGGDGSKMYTRDGRIVASRLQLLRRVAFCSTQVNAGWFPEEEGSVAAWLNQQYYHFDN